MWVPADPDTLLDDPAVRARNVAEDYMPYWAWVWPSSPPMAELVRRAGWLRGTEALELGSGLGMVGVAAGLAGLQVTFSDHDEMAVGIARRNAALNGLAGCEGLVLDWRGMAGAPDRKWPVILACDVIYEEGSHQPLLDALRRFMDPDGEAWIADPGRTRAPAFCSAAEEQGLDVEIRDEEGRVCPGDDRSRPALVPNEFRLLVLRHGDRGPRRDPAG